MSIKLKPKRSGPETYGVGYSVFRLFFGPENSLAQTSSNSLGAAGPVPAAARTTDRGQLPHPDPTDPSMRLTCPNLACCYGGWWDYHYEFHSWTEPDAEDRDSARGWKSLNQAKAEYAFSPDGASKWPELSSGLPTNEDPYRYVWEEEKLSDAAAAAKWDEIERTQDRKTVRDRLRSLFGLVEAGGAGAGAATSEAEALEAQAAGRKRLEAVIGHRTYFPRETDEGNHDTKRPLPPDDLALLRFFDKPRQFRLRRFRVKDVSAPLRPPPLELQTYPAAAGPSTAEPANDVEKKRDHTDYEPASDGFPLGRYRVLPHEIYPGIWRVSPCGGYLFLYAAEEPGKIYQDRARRVGENKMRPNKEASRGSGFRLWKWKLADITDKSVAAGEISSAARRRDETTSSSTSPLRKKAKLDKDKGQQESIVDTEKVEAGRAHKVKDDAPTRGGKDDLLLDHADFVFPGPNKAAFSYPARCVSKAWRAHACEFCENVAIPEDVDRESLDGSEDAGVSEEASSNETDQDGQSESWYENELVKEYGAAHHRGWSHFLGHDPFFFVTNQVVLRRWGIQSKKVLGVWSRPTQIRFFDYETNAELRSYALDNLFRAWNVRFKTSAWDSGADRSGTFAPHVDYDPGYGREDFELAAGEDPLDGAIVGMSPDARFIFLQLMLRPSCLVDADSDPIREMFGRISESRKTSSGEWKHLQPFPYVLLMWDLADGLDGNRVTLLPGCPNNRDVKYEQVEGSGLRSVDHHASGETVRTVKIPSVEQGTKDEDGDEREGGRPGALSTATTNEVAVNIVSWAKFLEDFTESGATDSSDFVLRLRDILPPPKPSEGSPDHSATQGQTKCLSQPEELPRRLHQLLYETNLSQQMMPVGSVAFRLQIKSGTSKGNEFVTGVNPELQGVVHAAINETKGLQFLQVRKR